MDNSIYEVEREDYKNFIGQLNKEMMDTEVHIVENCTFTKIKSKKNGKHLSTRISDSEKEEEYYFIFEYPDNDERIAPKPIMKINLDTKEEVQTFFNALNKLQLEAKKNVGNI